MSRVIIEIDRRTGTGFGDLECVGFVGRDGLRVRSSRDAAPMDVATAHTLIDRLRADCPNLILRAVPAPRGVLADA